MSARLELNETTTHAVGDAARYECAAENLAFVDCKLDKNGDLNKFACLAEGEKVTACVLKTFRELKAKCPNEFDAYKKCLSENEHDRVRCRKAQLSMMECWTD